MKATGGYNRRGEQVARGLFLIVFSRCTEPYPAKPELRAVVRYVRTVQSGHFMTASITLAGKRTYLCGAYGNNGLTCNASDCVWPKAVPVPPDLTLVFWAGGGHNTCGSEAPAMRD